jgi:hypothetical protein
MNYQVSFRLPISFSKHVSTPANVRLTCFPCITQGISRREDVMDYGNWIALLAIFANLMISIIKLRKAHPEDE